MSTSDELESTAVEPTTPPAPAEPKQQEDNASEGDETPKAPVSEANTNEIDYKAELERVQTQLSQAEHNIVELKKAKKEVNTEEVVDETINTEGVITAEEFTKQIESKYRAELAQTENRIKREMSLATIEEELSNVSSNPDEQALIKFHYENSIKQSGFTRSAIQQDLKRARLLANEKKLAIENEELKEALKAKNSVGNGSGGSNQDSQVPEDEPNFTPQERTVIKRLAEKQGISMKEYIRRNKGSLTNT